VNSDRESGGVPNHTRAEFPVAAFKRKKITPKNQEFFLESPGQNLTLTVLYVPYSLDSGHASDWSKQDVFLRVGCSNGAGLSLTLSPSLSPLSPFSSSSLSLALSFSLFLPLFLALCPCASTCHHRYVSQVDVWSLVDLFAQRRRVRR